MKAKYDVERAKLDLGKRDLISEVEYQEAKLALSDAEQRLKETEAKEISAAAAAQADLRYLTPARYGSGTRPGSMSNAPKQRSRSFGCALRRTASSIS